MVDSPVGGTAAVARRDGGVLGAGHRDLFPVESALYTPPRRNRDGADIQLAARIPGVTVYLEQGEGSRFVRTGALTG